MVRSRLIAVGRGRSGVGIQKPIAGVTRIYLLSAGIVLQISLNVYVQGSAFIAYVVRPGLWAITACVARWLPGQKPAGRPKVLRAAVWIGLLTGCLQVAVSVLFGLLEGFGKSPYSFHVGGLLINAWTLSTEILGSEISRSWLVNRLAGRRRPAFAIPIALAFALLGLPLSRIPRLSDRVAVIRFLGRDVLPSISNSLTCSLMTYIGGPLPAIAYRSVLALFWWFSPIIPNLSWGAVALIDTVIPMAGVFIAHAEYITAERPRKVSKDVRENTLSAIGASVVGMLLVWFSVGLLPVYPSVVATGSMQPYANPGDLVLSVKNVRNIDVGDVIEFRMGDKWVVHRIIEVQRQGDLKLYITKGDANSAVDKEPVIRDMVRGKVVAVIPSVGKISLALRRLVSR